MQNRWRARTRMPERARAPDWLTVEEALTRILAAASPLASEVVPLHEAHGRTLAEDAVSPIDQPPWDNSAMDGFAVRAADIRGARREAPVRMVLVEEVPAGQFATRRVEPGQAIRVNTGAPIPEGADTVVRIEHTDQWQGAAGALLVAAEQTDPGAVAGFSAGAAAMGVAAGRERFVMVHDDADAGRNVRARGEDIRAGDLVLSAGRVLRAAEIGVLAIIGKAEVAVHRRPRVAILSNGDELVDLDRFDEVLAGRRIVNSNAHTLAAAVADAGGAPHVLGIARDEIGSLRERLLEARDADVLITTAGASVGDHDLVKDALAELGFELDFWRVRIQPGSPFSFGRLGRTLVFGLAGNPVSALVTFEVLVRPVLRRLAARTDAYPRLVDVRVPEPIASRPGLTRFLRVRLARADDGMLEARLTGPQGSGIMTSLAQADALLVVPQDIGEVPAGSTLRALPLEPRDAGSATLAL